MAPGEKKATKRQSIHPSAVPADVDGAVALVGASRTVGVVRDDGCAHLVEALELVGGELDGCGAQVVGELVGVAHPQDHRGDCGLRLKPGKRHLPLIDPVKVTGATKELDQGLIDRARQLAGLKGYVTNLPATAIHGQGVIDAYHDLYQVERTFQMTKSDLRARPIFHHDRDAIEAHLTVVFAALAVARELQAQTGVSLKKLVQTLRPLRTVTIDIDGHTITAKPHLTDDAEQILANLPPVTG